MQGAGKGSIPNMPKVPLPPPPPPIPDKAQEQEAVDERRRAVLAAKGRQSTILTDSAALGAAPSTLKPTLGA